MTESSYTITLTDRATHSPALAASRDCLTTSLQIATTNQVQAGELDSARRIADEARVAAGTLETVRAAALLIA